MRIKEIELQTASLALVETFYTNVLQLPLVQRLPHRLSFRAGYSTIHFTDAQKVTGAYHFAFLIPPNLFLPSLQWVQSQTSVLPFNDKEEIAHFHNWNAKAFYFHDEEQNILEFITHYDLEESREETFTPQAITGLGEIGIGVEDVGVTCQQLHTIYNIPYYIKGPNLPNFAAMGEEDGLLIVSAAGRGWVPTGQAAALGNVKAKLEVNGKEVFVEW